MTQAPALARNAASGPPTSFRRYPGVDAVLQRMADTIAAWRVDERVRAAAVQLAVEGGAPAGGPGSTSAFVNMRDSDAVTAAVYQAVIRRVLYTRDPVRAELLQAPLDTLRRQMGDCDDLTILGGALLASIGVPVRVVAVGYEGTVGSVGGTPARGAVAGKPGFDHVYLETDPSGNGLWQVWDATLGTKAGDRAPAVIARQKIVPVAPSGSFGLADAKGADAKAAGTKVAADTGAKIGFTRPPKESRNAPKSMPTVPVRMAPQGGPAQRDWLWPTHTPAPPVRVQAQSVAMIVETAPVRTPAQASAVLAETAPGRTPVRQHVAAARRTPQHRDAAQYVRLAAAYGLTLPLVDARRFAALAPAKADAAFEAWIAERRKSAGAVIVPAAPATGSASGSGVSTTSSMGEEVLPAEARPTLSPLLLVGLAGAALLLLGGKGGAAKPTGKTVRTTQVTDESFGA